jgi:hypothetical protein
MALYRLSGDPSYARLLRLLNNLLATQGKIMGDLTALNAAMVTLNSAVAANTAAVASAASLIASLKTATDQAEIDAVTTQVGTVTTKVNANNATIAALLPVSTTSS